MATVVEEEKKDFSQQLYNIGCVWEVKADNLRVCLGGIIPTYAGAQVSENHRETARLLNLQTATWHQIERITPPIVGVGLLICARPPSCQTCCTLAACLISLNQIVPYQRKQTM